MRVLCCGGRKYSDAETVRTTLDNLHKDHGITAIIEGGAPGADTLARKWAKANGLEPITERAIWEDLSHSDAVIRTRPDGSQYDARAGIRRNQLMLEKHKPTICVGFEGNDGTADMLRRAKYAGIQVIEVGSRGRRMT